jgi:LCP family protein required for cell wall assembly
VLALDAQEGEHLVHVGSIPRRDRVYRMSWSPHNTRLTLTTAWDTLAPVIEQPSQGQESLQPRGGRLGQRLLIAAVVLLFAAGAFYGSLVIATRVDKIFAPGNELRLPTSLGKLPGVDSGTGDSGVESRINVLVMGLDRRPREGKAPARTDTMFVLTIDPQNKTAGILGIPRDLWVEIPNKDGDGYFQERINAAFVLGEVNDYDGGGPALAVKTTEHTLGIKIDHYVVIDFEGFKEVIDALGGVDVDVPTYLRDDLYSESELPGDYDPQEFEPGIQHMDGSHALAYARIRRGSSDLDRIQRQQRVIFAVMDKALSLNVLADPLDLWKQYKNTIDTDVNDWQITGLAALAAQIPPERIVALSLGPVTVPYTTPQGAAVLVAAPEGIQQIVEALFADQQILDEGAMVEVQNGTGEPGLASRVVDYLVNLGLPRSSLVTSNAPEQDLGQPSMILDYSGKRYTAKRLAEWLGLPADRVRSAGPEDVALKTSSEADIVLVVGTDIEVDRLTATAAGAQEQTP